MRQRSLLALLAVTIAVGVVAGYVAWDRQSRVSSELRAGELIFPGLIQRVNEVREITIGDARRGFTIAAEEDDRWVVREKGGYPAQPDLVKKAVVALADLRSLEPRTSNPELYERIGVNEIDRPGSEAIRIALKDEKGGELAALLIGKVRQADTGVRPAQLYVRRPEQAQSWLAEGRLDIKADPVAWLVREMLRVPRERIMRFEIEHPDGSRIGVSRADGKSEDYTFTGLPAEGKPKVTNANGMMAGLELLIFEDVAKESDIALENARKATIRTFDGLVVTVRCGTREGKPWASFAAAFDVARADEAKVQEGNDKGLLTRAEVEKEVAEINARVAGWLYQIPDYRAENFIRTAEDMVMKDAS
ncbi:MAG: DUF4340 domain-containing protein [Alphaproteobacteria bacterium]|nr:DUF4340 domain-containing protein [Alphaproteobacteria bacterium]